MGLGEYRWAHSRDIHYGQWARLEHGRGVRMYDYGDTYRGEFKVGERCGHGTTTSIDALGQRDRFNYHVGFYYGGKAQGAGHELSTGPCQTSPVFYHGEYVGGLRHGKGRMTFGDPSSVHQNPVGTYEGEFRGDLPDGKGQYFWSNGGWHSGWYRKGVRNGHGKRMWPNGDVFEGEFVNGVPDGHGRFAWSAQGGGGGGGGAMAGEVYEGEFLSGVKHGWGIITSRFGAVLEGQFLFNKMWGDATFTASNGDRCECVCVCVCVCVCLRASARVYSD